MDAFKKLFSIAAFLLFLLALVWLFTYDSDVNRQTASRSNSTSLNDRNVRHNNPPVRNNVNAATATVTPATYVAPPAETPRQTVVESTPVAVNSGSFVGKFNAKSYTRQGQTGIYKGAFDSNGNPTGFGVMEYRNGNKFIGEYRNGQRYQGFSLFSSTGKVKQRQYSNGDVASDKSRRDLKIMRAKSYAREGQSGTYSGPFKGNVPHGVGVFSYSNGDIFVGTYSNGLRHGEGTLCKANGKCYKQVYNNNSLMN